MHAFKDKAHDDSTWQSKPHGSGVKRYEESWKQSSSPRGDADAAAEFLDMAGFSLFEGSVIEVGSGSGHFLDYLARNSDIKAFGSDLAFQAVQNIRKKTASPLMVLDASCLPLCDAAVDACFSFDVIEHLYDVQSHFRETFRILKPGGVYYFQTPNCLTNPLAEVLKHGRKGLRWREYHPSLQSIRSLKRISKNVGFSEITFYKMSPVTPHKMSRLPRMLRFLFALIPWRRLPMVCQTNFWVTVKKQANHGVGR